MADLKILERGRALAALATLLAAASAPAAAVTTGDFTNYVARDVVSYIDAHYRTIPARESRGAARRRGTLFQPDALGPAGTTLPRKKAQKTGLRALCARLSAYDALRS